MNLHSDLVKWSNLHDLVYRGNGEWSAACPVCGGADHSRRDKSDRFRMFAPSGGHDARGWCRRCGYFEWASDENGKRPSLAEIEQAQELQRQLRQQEEQRMKDKISELQRAAYWQGYHDAMTQQHRQLWAAQGIDSSLQDWFKLGYKETYRYQHGSNFYESPAMTIPIFSYGWEAINVQYRLTRPAGGAGKYRFTAGLPAPLFITEPDQELTGPVLVVEGAKKAIVTWSHLVVRASQKLKIVAVPSKMPGKELIGELVNCEPVYIALDPDAYAPEANGASAAKRLGDLVGDRARFVRLPAKPDDLLTEYGFTTGMIMQYVMGATKRA